MVIENVFSVMNRIVILHADITQIKADAIVNSANSSLMGGGGVDGAIHLAAGPELLAECRNLGGCEAGQAKITRAYRLKAKYIIHTVGPHWHGGKYRESDLLSSCYLECLKLSVQFNCKTIAFPAISCGIYNYPVVLAAEIAIREVTAFLKKNSSIKRVFFVCYDQEISHIYHQVYNAYRNAEYNHSPLTNWSTMSLLEQEGNQKGQPKEPSGLLFQKSKSSSSKEQREQTLQKDSKLKIGTLFKNFRVKNKVKSGSDKH